MAVYDGTARLLHVEVLQGQRPGATTRREKYAFDNIKAVLRDADMGIDDLVKVRQLGTGFATFVCSH